MEHIIIGGGVGSALAHDATLHGFKVTLLEKGELVSGTTGRHHRLLHSGARYVIHDPDTARECWAENQILRRIVPEALEQNDGLFVASAKTNGANIRPISEVVDIITNGTIATGVKIFDHRMHHTYTLQGDLIVNAAGPWAGKIAAMLGIEIPVRPAPGVMASVNARLTNMIINRLHPADEGDIIVPQRNQSIMGTSILLADDPDH